MGSTIPRAILLFTAAAGLPPPGLPAQRAPTREEVRASLPPDADARFRALNDSARARPANGPLQYRLGLLAWAIAERDADERGGPMRFDSHRTGQIAGDALRKAVMAEPDSARYRLALIRYTTAIAQNIPTGSLRVALAAARAEKDAALVADVALEYGRFYWRTYDGYAHRALRLTSDPARSVGDAMNPLARSAEAIKEASAVAPEVADALRVKMEQGQLPASLVDMLVTSRQDLEAGMLPMLTSLREAREHLHSTLQASRPGESGEGAYLRAEELFREAYAVEPGSRTAFHQIAMVLAERSRWGELLAVATAHTRLTPADPMGWLATGLAAHRLSSHRAAEAAFESALVRLDPVERSRLDRLERVLDEAGRKQTTELDSVARFGLTNLYWAAADQLWSRAGATPRTEFLARVAYAELRWTVEELRVRGADTDRGDAHVRWGPPHEIIAVGPASTDAGVRPLVTTYWWYRWGLLLAFEGSPRLGVATVAFGDDAFVAQMRETAPVRWNNIEHETVERMATQVARFRAGDDSADVVFAAAVPIADIRSSTDVDGPVRTDFWLIGGDGREGRRDSIVSVAGSTWSVVSFVNRVTRREHLYRVEATADGAMRAGQTTGLLRFGDDSVAAFPARGPGISDVLLGSSVSGPAMPRRWDDLAVTPIAGAISRGTPLALVWENYEFAERDGAASYTVDVMLAPERSGAGQVALRAIGAVARALGAGDDGAARVVFDRARPHAAIIADHVSVDLGDTEPGRYRLALRVTDVVSGQSRVRTAVIEVR